MPRRDVSLIKKGRAHALQEDRRHHGGWDAHLVWPGRRLPRAAGTSTPCLRRTVGGLPFARRAGDTRGDQPGSGRPQQRRRVHRGRLLAPSRPGPTLVIRPEPGRSGSVLCKLHRPERLPPRAQRAMHDAGRSRRRRVRWGPGLRVRARKRLRVLRVRERSATTNHHLWLHRRVHPRKRGARSLRASARGLGLDRGMRLRSPPNDPHRSRGQRRRTRNPSEHTLLGLRLSAWVADPEDSGSLALYVRMDEDKHLLLLLRASSLFPRELLRRSRRSTEHPRRPRRHLRGHAGRAGRAGQSHLPGCPRRPRGRVSPLLLRSGGPCREGPRLPRRRLVDLRDVHRRLRRWSGRIGLLTRVRGLRWFGWFGRRLWHRRDRGNGRSRRVESRRQWARGKRWHIVQRGSKRLGRSLRVRGRKRSSLGRGLGRPVLLRVLFCRPQSASGVPGCGDVAGCPGLRAQAAAVGSRPPEPARSAGRRE
jgi:hypothetical protein